MTKDTEPLQEALTAHYPTGEWMQPCGNHVLCCSCGENLWGVDRDACKAAWRTHVIEALATPAGDELGFDPTAEVGDEVFSHDTIGSHFGNGGRLDPAAVAPTPVTVTTGPCQHRWSHAPTVGYYLCVDCRERHDHGSPMYEQIKASLAHPPHPAPVDPVAGGEALREALEWYRDQLCEGFCEGFTPRICKAAMEENPTGGDCSGCRAVIALAALKGPAA